MTHTGGEGVRVTHWGRGIRVTHSGRGGEWRVRVTHWEPGRKGVRVTLWRPGNMGAEDTGRVSCRRRDSGSWDPGGREDVGL